MNFSFVHSGSDGCQRKKCAIFSNVLGCYKITTVFSHAQTVVLCVSCSTVLCQPTGGRARLTEGMFFILYIIIKSWWLISSRFCLFHLTN